MDARRRVTELLKIGDVTLDLQLAAVLDYFVAAVVFGQSQQFSEQTMSAFFTLAHQLLENLRGRDRVPGFLNCDHCSPQTSSISTHRSKKKKPADKKMTLEENMAFFKATMEQHASLHSDCDDDGKLFDFDPKCTALVSQYFRRGFVGRGKGGSAVTHTYNNHPLLPPHPRLPFTGDVFLITIPHLALFKQYFSAL